MTTSPHIAPLLDLTRALHPQAAEDAARFGATFAPELDTYTEIVRGRGGHVAGVMTRGEDASFGERVQQALASWDMPEPGRAWHARLAKRFEHKRAFFKAEWAAGDAGEGLQHLAAFYFRRRPEVGDVVDALLEQGVDPALTDRARAMARMLGKDTVHFVSAALRSDSEAIFHKLYFSQWVRPETQAAVQGRIERVLLEFGVHPRNIQTWSIYHDRLAPAEHEPSIFVSLSFTDTDELPWVKIDYPEVSPALAAALLPMSEQRDAEQEAQRFCQHVGVRKLSFLGVRLGHAEGIQIKLYGDHHGAKG